MRIILLSGPIASGKSTLSKGLEDRFGAIAVKTNTILKSKAHTAEPTRSQLQRLGERLDRSTNGDWVREALDIKRRENPNTIMVVDAVRIRKQVESIQRAYGRNVVHVHLLADNPNLEKRYKRRSRGSSHEFKDYSSASKNKTEKNISNLEGIADIVIDTGKCDEGDV